MRIIKQTMLRIVQDNIAVSDTMRLLMVLMVANGRGKMVGPLVNAEFGTEYDRDKLRG